MVARYAADMYEFGGAQQSVQLTLYTDAFVIRGSLETRQRRVTDILNHADDPFLVLSGVTVDEFGPHGQASTAEHAQVNLASVLFAVADNAVDTAPELRTPKVAEIAMIAIPPFRVTGRIHLLPERDVRSGLNELHGAFLPVTDAVYWSDSLGEARTTAALVAVNHARAQILAPHKEVDPWAGLDTSGASTAPVADEGQTGAAATPVDPWTGLPVTRGDAG
jgi:hypothetical protein